MRNSENCTSPNDDDGLAVVVAQVKKEERKARARAVSRRLEALADHIFKTGMSSETVAELLCHEAARYERESQELH